MIKSDILGYGRQVEVLNNHTIGSGIEVNQNGQKFAFTTKLSLQW